jgi:hypothetical protein
MCKKQVLKHTTDVIVVRAAGVRLLQATTGYHNITLHCLKQAQTTHKR